MKNIAYFITSHGFGHAARACAVINELSKSENFRFFIFTKVPEWFFLESLNIPFNYQNHDTDVGLVQKDPFNEDLSATLIRLGDKFPISEDEIRYLTNKFSLLNIDLVICDISPVGLKAAAISLIPSILIENFTWDWIYEPYLVDYPDIKKYSDYLKPIFQLPNYHFQTDPICFRNPDLPLIGPIYREPTKSKEEIRDLLGVKKNEQLILVTMGGIPYELSESPLIENTGGSKIIIPGSKVEQETHIDNMIFLPHHHQYFHPNLVHASDIVIGKVGYSTIAEVYSAKIPFLYLPRSNFRESQYLVNFIKKRMVSEEINQNFLKRKDWINFALELKKSSLRSVQAKNGSKEFADFINKL